MFILSRGVKKIVCILLLLIIFTTACANKNLYQLKTDLSDKEGVHKIISQMDWDGDKVKEFEVQGKNIAITMSKDYEDYDLKNSKSFVVNAINLIILTGAQNVDYLYDENLFFSIDYEIVDMIINTKSKKSVEYYRNDEEEFKKLQKYLKVFQVKGVKH
ncbi:MAG: hypothetical protein E7E99_01980 [Peptoniphilus lacydonensis]|uniref:hypothetical protein n=1 Tax=Peptoniphilus lacydonensis TaxID=1673725 RepID=UPI0029020D53|nr:hypothetical protein [Peptoniphilus lacydonensis]MDU1954339.1 hypothetical protein [Peptoniphilus lacydonensis]MDU2109359.1 hypothetical protein [Peptoniphilus lacydonensis]MDU5274802.1 hypothetical protein [Peptoniphilus lacydonensis]MDU8954153.1 hypothetical protein [Streptococcus sp.]